jgi:hypothetical protein
MADPKENEQPNSENPELMPTQPDKLATVAAASGSPEVSARAAGAIPYQQPVAQVPDATKQPPRSFAKLGEIARGAKGLISAGAPPAFAWLLAGAHNPPAATGDVTSAGAPDYGLSGASPWDEVLRSGPSPETTPVADKRTKGQKAIGNIEAQLGDMAAATEGGTAGGGIAGAFRVARASAARQRQDREDQVKMATANAQMLHEQIAAHKLSEEMMAPSIAAGEQSYKEALIVPGSQTLATGKTGAELLKLMKNRSIDTTKDGVFLTGRRQAGVDENGVPRFESLYSVVRPGPQANQRFKPTDSQLKFLNDFIPGSNFPKDQEFSWHDWYVLNQQATAGLTQVLVREEALTKLGQTVRERKIQEGMGSISTNSAVVKAIGAVGKNEDGLNPVRVYHWLLNHPELESDGTLPHDWSSMYKRWAGGGEPGDEKKFDDMESRLSAIDAKTKSTANDYLDSIDKKLAEAPSPNVVISVQGELQRRLHDPETKPEQMKGLRDRLDQASNALVAMEAHDKRTKEADDAIKNGDVDEVARELVANKVTRSELQTRGLTEAFVQKALAKARELDADYSYPRQEGWLNAAKAPQQATFFGNVNSLMADNGTIDQLMEAGTKISDHDFQILNKMKNWYSLQSGQPGIAGYSGTVVGIADDYAKVMGGGVGSDKAREMILNLINPNASPEQRKSAAEAIRGAVRSQAEGRLGQNPFMWSMYGDLVPGAKEHREELDQKRADLAKKGVKTDSSGRPVAGVHTGSVNLFGAPSAKATPGTRFPGTGHFRGMIGYIDPTGTPRYFHNEQQLQTFITQVQAAQKAQGQ